MSSIRHGKLQITLRAGKKAVPVYQLIELIKGISSISLP